MGIRPTHVTSLTVQPPSVTPNRYPQPHQNRWTYAARPSARVAVARSALESAGRRLDVRTIAGSRR